MRNHLFPALFLPLVLLHPTMVHGQETRTDLAANAALKYWQAFAQLPTLDKDQEKLLGEWHKAPLDESALKLIALSEKSRLFLHRGSKLQRCDWSLDYEDGMELLLPYLARARDLARLAALHGRHEFAQGHWAAGTEDATAILALARHVGSEPTMLCILVRYGIETMAIDLVTPYLPELQAYSPRIVSAYEALPAAPTFSQAFVAEKRFFIEWLIRKMKEAEGKQKGAWRDVLKGAFLTPESDEIIKQIGTFDRAIELTEGTLSVSDHVAKLVALPRQEFHAQYPEFKKKAKADNVLAGHLLTAADNVLAVEDRNRAQMAMLKAAMAVVSGGPDKLKEVKDPFGDGPFEYRALGNGFELKSKLLFRDKPVTLTVGQAKKS